MLTALVILRPIATLISPFINLFRRFRNYINFLWWFFRRLLNITRRVYKACDQYCFSNGHGFTFMMSACCSTLVYSMSLFLHRYLLAAVLHFTKSFELCYESSTGVFAHMNWDTCMFICVFDRLLTLVGARLKLPLWIHEFLQRYTYDQTGRLYCSTAAVVVKLTSGLNAYLAEFCVSLVYLNASVNFSAWAP